MNTARLPLVTTAYRDTGAVLKTLAEASMLPAFAEPRDTPGDTTPPNAPQTIRQAPSTRIR